MSIWSFEEGGEKQCKLTGQSFFELVYLAPRYLLGTQVLNSSSVGLCLSRLRIIQQMGDTFMTLKTISL